MGKPKDGRLLGQRANKAGLGGEQSSSGKSEHISAIVSSRREIIADCFMRAPRLGWCSVWDAYPAHPCCHGHHVTTSQKKPQTRLVGAPPITVTIGHSLRSLSAKMNRAPAFTDEIRHFGDALSIVHCSGFSGEPAPNRHIRPGVSHRRKISATRTNAATK